jgi:hypothetical protein
MCSLDEGLCVNALLNRCLVDGLNAGIHARMLGFEPSKDRGGVGVGAISATPAIIDIPLIFRGFFKNFGGFSGKSHGALFGSA